MRKTPTIEQQQAMQYKTPIHSSASLNLSKNNTILKNICFVTDEDDVNFAQSSNVKIIRQSSKEPSQTIAPKKNLPHKKRITKKLKSISHSVDQMVDQTYHSQHAHDLTHIQSQHEQPTYSVSNHQQNDSLNLTMNQQPIQLTTRVNQSTNQTEYIQSDHFASTSEATNSMHTVELQQMPITEPQSARFTCDMAKFSCEICGVQTQSQLSFFNHLKLHYEPETIPQNCTKIDNVRGASDLVMEQNDQSMYQMSNERGSNQVINASPVIMTDNFVRLQSNEQDFSLSGIGTEDVTDDESINGYNDTGLNVIKSEQNEFSDPEDMLENSVLDKVQRVVDSYIENGTSDVKNFIELNENQHHNGSLVDNSCNWTATATNNSHNLPNSSVYNKNVYIEKSESVNNMNGNSFVITSNNQSSKETIQQSTQNHIINNSNQTVIERPEELTLMYDINVNDKDFPIMDDASTESKFLE